jgi:cell division protein FtsB
MVDKSKSVVADELVFTATHTFFNDMSKEEIKNWADRCMEFVHFGLGYEDNQILHATLHMDEKTPHIHCVVVPLVKKLDKRTNTERFTISKKQFIHDKEHLSELQDEYCEYLNMCGFALERGTKHSDREHINIKEFKKLTKSLTNELDLKDDKLSKSINELEEKMKSNKTIMFDKESVKVKKETFDSMNKVVEEAKKVKDLKPKLNNAYKNLKEVTNDYSKIHQQNMKLEDENRNLKYENTNLRYKAFTLSNTIDTLKNVINKMANFVYHLVADGLIPRHKEDEFNDEFEEFISGKKKNKDKDDSLVL